MNAIEPIGSHQTAILIVPGMGSDHCAGLVSQSLKRLPGIAELLITLFVFVTAPVSANLMAQAALHLKLASLAPVPKDAVPERRPG